MRRAPLSLVPRTARHARVLPGVIAIAAAVVCSPAGASASALASSGASTGARVDSPHDFGLERSLPVPTASAARDSASSGRWLIAASGDRTRLAALAAQVDGTFDSTLGILSVPTSQASAVAGKLGSAVRWSGRDVPAVRSSSYDQPDNLQSPWSRSLALAPSLTPAPGTLARIGIVDDAVDRSVVELASVDVINGVGALDPHGTMVASTAAAPYDGVGVVGVAPGAPVLSWGTTLFCSDAARGIVNLVKRGAQVINFSLALEENCGAMLAAVEYAYAKNVTMVAASGNEGDKKNILSFPGAYPHVITAAAVDTTLQAASFSSFSDYVDIAAPGVDVPVDVPLRFDTKDRSADGLAIVSGTSFASPFIAGSVSWILGARPGLDPSQVAAVLRAGARDVDGPGWNEHSGFGLVQVAPSLAAPAPPADLLEPNDYPAFTTGKGTFAKRSIWTGKRPVTVSATADSADDYVDAYRIKVPPRTTVKATLKPTSGLLNLFGFDQAVKSFSGKPIDSSTRSGLATDTIKLRNSGARSRVAFIVVNAVPSAGVRTLASYSLSVKRG